MNVNIGAKILSISHALDLGCRWVASGFLLAMLALVMLQVVARYIFDSPPGWTEEMARYCMIWFGLLGATISFKSRSDLHILKPPTTRFAFIHRGATGVRAVAIILFLAPILWYSLIGPDFEWQRSFLYRHSLMQAESIEMSTLLIAIVVPVFITVIFVHLLARMVESTRPKKPQEE